MRRPETRAPESSSFIRHESSVALADAAPQTTNDDGCLDLGDFPSSDGFLDQSPDASSSGRFPRVTNAGHWRKSANLGSVRSRRFYSEAERKRVAQRPTVRRHSEGWARALNSAGMPVCWVCDTRNHATARACDRCGQRLVNRPSADSSVQNVPTLQIESEWSLIHSACIALTLVIAVGFLLLG